MWSIVEFCLLFNSFTLQISLFRGVGWYVFIFVLCNICCILQVSEYFLFLLTIPHKRTNACSSEENFFFTPRHVHVEILWKTVSIFLCVPLKRSTLSIRYQWYEAGRIFPGVSDLSIIRIRYHLLRLSCIQLMPGYHVKVRRIVIESSSIFSLTRILV